MSPRKTWQNHERDAASAHRGKHVGGPGQPDYVRGDTQGEVKLRRIALSKSEVMAECQKGRTEIDCNAGFSESAVAYVKRYRPEVKLITGGINRKRR